MNSHIYKHYKGGIYRIITGATDTETQEDVIVYEDLNGRRWVRPSEMFYGEVEIEGVKQPRFIEIGMFFDN